MLDSFTARVGEAAEASAFARIEDEASLHMERDVARDRARMLYAYGRNGLLINVVAAVCLFLMVVTPATASGLTGWLGCVMAVVILRAADVMVLHKWRAMHAFDGRREILWFAVGTMANGLLWAVFPIVFFPLLGVQERAATAVILAALAGGGATVLAPSLTLAMAYCVGQLVPASLMFLFSAGRENTYLGLLGFAMLIAMLVCSRIAHNSAVVAFKLCHINKVLLDQAEAQRTQTEAVNAKLQAARADLHEANISLEDRIRARTADLANEIAERNRYARALAKLASTDPLTGLYNRTSFADRLAHMLADAASNATSLAVLFLDLDNFKQVNDVRGHAVGDLVLRAAANLLSETGGPGVELARWGGDEFVMALPTPAGGAAALALAQRVRAALIAPLSAGLDTINLDVTIGIALFPNDDVTQDELIRAADVAMYAAKKEGKGRIKFFDPALAESMSERHGLEQALHRALANNELSLCFQPIVSARHGVCQGFEALLRWTHPQRGKISPAMFIPIAEQSGQIFTIGRWVLHEACRIAVSWPSDAPPITVNVSVAQVIAGGLLEDVASALSESGLPADRLQIEITESMFVSDHLRVTPVFEALRAQGIKILLDDFGTGFSSLAYLGKLPIDVIKIDQSFVHAAERDGYAIIGAILSIARALGLQVTAEGVETESQRDKLAALGVDRLQGYLISHPIPEHAVLAWLDSAARRAA